jgi:molybdenum cofactor cytidylyltransferase
MANSSRVAAIILAAGESKRFGSPKQLLNWRGRPLLRHVTLQSLAAPVDEIIVVLGAYAERIAPVLRGLPVTLTINHAWPRGMSESVKLGLRAVRGDVDAALFLLADQPGATPALCQRLIRSHVATQALIVAPRAGARPGNPVLFARDLFPQLMQTSGDQGGRTVMKAHPDRILWLETDASALADIDRPEDVAKC